MKLKSLIPIAVSVAFLACDKKEKTSSLPPTVNLTQTESFGSRNQTLGWDIFQELNDKLPAENIIISPYSIHTALNMMFNGAANATLHEGLTFLNFKNGTLNELNSEQQQIDIALYHHNGGAKITVANAFFHDPTRIATLPSFRSALDTTFKAYWAQDNFNSPTALQNINQWVATQTNQRIPKVIESIASEDVAFIINALHFQADWETGFAPEMTTTREFTLSNGQKIQVPFVMGDREFHFAVGDELQLVDIPFKGGQFSLSLIQPNSQFNNWIATVTSEKVETLYNSLIKDRAMVTFPKFELEFNKDLVETLFNLGLTSPFLPGIADFSQMGTALIGPTLFAKTVLHKTYLRIDEKGAEGAAVTSIGMGTTSMPPYFGFENPFVISLRHIPSGTILFLGKVADPS